MDPNTLLTIADQSILLLTFVATVAGQWATERIIEAGVEKGKQLYRIVSDRFQKVPDQGRAVKVLENFKDDPEEYTINLRNQLLTVLKADPQFVSELRTFLGQSAVQEIIVSSGSVARGNKMSNTTGKGTQRIQADNNSRVEDNEMNIG